MKIITRIVMNITTGKVLEEESYDYSGPIAECKGGGSSSTTTVDPIYNARMAALSERNQEMADEMFNMFKYGVMYDPTASGGTRKTGEKVLNPEWESWNKANEAYQSGIRSYDPYGSDKRTNDRYSVSGSRTSRAPRPGAEPSKYIAETENITMGEQEGYNPNNQISEMDLMMKQIESEYGMVGDRARTEKAGLQLDRAKAKAGMELLPGQTSLAKTTMAAQEKAVTEKSGVLSSFYEDAMAGVDVEGRIGEARSGIQQNFAREEESTKRSMARMGVDPTSGAAAESFKSGGIQKALALSGSETAIRRGAETEDFERKRAALGVGL